MNINNLNTYSKPSFSLAAMCLDWISSSPPVIKTTKLGKKVCSTAIFMDRNGNKVGVREVAQIECIGQAKAGDIFHEVEFDYIKAYKKIDAHKARMAIIRNK